MRSAGVHRILDRMMESQLRSASIRSLRIQVPAVRKALLQIEKLTQLSDDDFQYAGNTSDFIWKSYVIFVFR